MEQIIPIKGNKNNLTPKELKLFDWIQQTWEHNKNDFHPVQWNDSKIKALLKDKDIAENHNTSTKPFKITNSVPANTIHFTIPPGQGVTKAFIGHLRNAYAHLHIEGIPETNELHLQDWKVKKKNKVMECTMDARISFDFLDQLVSIMLQDYLEVNNKN